MKGVIDRDWTFVYVIRSHIHTLSTPLSLSVTLACPDHIKQWKILTQFITRQAFGFEKTTRQPTTQKRVWNTCTILSRTNTITGICVLTITQDLHKFPSDIIILFISCCTSILNFTEIYVPDQSYIISNGSGNIPSQLCTFNQSELWITLIICQADKSLIICVHTLHLISLSKKQTNKKQH